MSEKKFSGAKDAMKEIFPDIARDRNLINLDLSLSSFVYSIKKGNEIKLENLKEFKNLLFSTNELINSFCSYYKVKNISKSTLEFEGELDKALDKLMLDLYKSFSPSDDIPRIKFEGNKNLGRVDGNIQQVEPLVNAVTPKLNFKNAEDIYSQIFNDAAVRLQQTETLKNYLKAMWKEANGDVIPNDVVNHVKNQILGNDKFKQAFCKYFNIDTTLDKTALNNEFNAKFAEFTDGVKTSRSSAISK